MHASEVASTINSALNIGSLRLHILEALGFRIVAATESNQQCLGTTHGRIYEHYRAGQLEGRTLDRCRTHGTRPVLST